MFTFTYEYGTCYIASHAESVCATLLKDLLVHTVLRLHELCPQSPQTTAGTIAV